MPLLNDCPDFDWPHRTALHGGARQHWVIALSAPENASYKDIQRQVLWTLGQWTELIPGSITRPKATVLPDEPHVLPVALPGEHRLVELAFDYHGQDALIPTPTWRYSRRERVDGLCPGPSVNAVVLSAGDPTELSLPASHPAAKPITRPKQYSPPITDWVDYERAASKLGALLGSPLLWLGVGALGAWWWTSRQNDPQSKVVEP